MNHRVRKDSHVSLDPRRSMKRELSYCIAASSHSVPSDCRDGFDMASVCPPFGVHLRERQLSVAA